MKDNTDFASAERVGNKKVKEQFDKIKKNDLSIKFINSVSNLVAILNSERQIIFSNQALLDYTKLEIEELLGKRPGEVFGCMHSNEKSGGCGTTEFCSQCGAVNAILESQNKGMSIKVCRILKHNYDALEFIVQSNKIEVEDEEFYVYSLSDQSHENRRKILERIFFHDLMNTAGGLKGFIELLEDSTPEEKIEMQAMLKQLSVRLIDEIDTQRQLRAAEGNELIPNLQFADAVEIIESVQSSFLSHALRKSSIKTRVPNKNQFIKIQTDIVLIKRILVNLVKNALEAVEFNETIEIGIDKVTEDRILFFVSNPGVIPRKIQLQLFQRSFSTKAPDRGLGTYSVKLLTENYLKGKVSFISNSAVGTIFYIDLPRYENNF